MSHNFLVTCDLFSDLPEGESRITLWLLEQNALKLSLHEYKEWLKSKLESDVAVTIT